MKTILTITGSDSSGGSGVQADIRTITELGGQSVSVITCITIQNTLGIQEFYNIPPDVISSQIDAVVNDVQPEIVKVGMIRNVQTLSVIVAALRKYAPEYVLYDPVVFSSRGDMLMETHLLAMIRQQLLPLCSLIILRKGEMDMITGGDALENVVCMDETPVHGLANSLSAAIAYYLSTDLGLEEARKKAAERTKLLTVNRPITHSRSHKLYADFLKAIDDYRKQRSDVAFYADYLNVSSRYLSQVTSRICAMSPKAIIEQKLVEALEADLKTTAKTIQEIAYDYGFSSQAHFTKMFKRIKGKTPTEYRKNN